MLQFLVLNKPSSHIDNRKNNFLVLGEGDTFGINGGLGEPFSKTKAKFCLSFHYNGDNSYLFVNGKKN